MAAITLDTDIAAAVASTTPGSLALDKINAQHYRNALAAQQAHWQALIDNERETIGILRAQKAPTELTMRERTYLELVSKYMTTSTATLPATIEADAAGDAARLRAAIDAALSTLVP